MPLFLSQIASPEPPKTPLQSQPRHTLVTLETDMACIRRRGTKWLERLAELASRDGLTGLLNRRAFMAEAESLLAAAKRYSHSLAAQRRELAADG
jgi:PleD family two-component response regulator